ncbi:unnamed protein product [Darwinula stevensoni]|uniref:AIG1-type G domain-containing protein n=1 Tax=Darwinula stevensoni TaxID=69355 RepID=A0A7R8WY49_9CRUS|nr:unnamed protein product [Darwinula stevensoni]CAG0878992.1 unnamed protein product [Darwinula stevensoni]
MALAEDQLPRKKLTPNKIITVGEHLRKFVFGESPSHKGYVGKVILLVGITGAGKSTLVNSFVNHLLVVKFLDNFRYELIEEEKAQVNSQTKFVTSYTFHTVDSSNVSDTVTIIDTPGLADTDGIEEDKKLFAKIRNFFESKDEFSINEVHLIGIVVPISRIRLDATEKYVYNQILSLFGNDVAENVSLVVTHMDGSKEPKHALNAAKTAGIPISAWYGFNNATLYDKPSAAKEEVYFQERSWKLRTDQCHKLMNDLTSSKWKTVSLVLTKDVLEHRSRLEENMKNLQEKVKQGSIKLVHLEQLYEEKQKSDIRGKTHLKNALQGLMVEFAREMTQMHKLTIQAHECLSKLYEIGLQKNSPDIVEYLDLLTKREELSSEPGYEKRLEHLREIRVVAKYLKKMQFGEGVFPFDNMLQELDKKGLRLIKAEDEFYMELHKPQARMRQKHPDFSVCLCASLIVIAMDREWTPSEDEVQPKDQGVTLNRRLV